MKQCLLLALALCALAAPSLAQTQGADVIVGDLYDPRSWGSSGGISAFSIGTTSCNIGNVPLNWFALPSVDHPVIGQNVYRIKDGEFEQLGMSWLKHGFFALSQNLCSPCNPTPGTTLGVGCSDPYSGGLNGSQGNLGPRSDVNATTGVFVQPNPPGYSGVIARRLQIANADLDPAQNAGAIYLGEGHYIAADDAAAGHDDNNASWRQVSFTGSGTSYTMGFVGSTMREDPAIVGWQSFVPGVQLQYVDVPGDGRFIVGYLPTPQANGRVRHFFAVHNLNSHRSARALTINFPAGATLTNPYFRDVDHHSGEPYTNTDWTPMISAGGVTFVNDGTFAQNQNANALRWGTCYSFAIESEMMPGTLALELFRPGLPAQVNVPAFGAPPPPPYAVNKPEAHLDVDGLTNDPFTGPIVANRSPGDLVFMNIATDQASAGFVIGAQTGPAVPNAFAFGDQVVNLNALDPTFALVLQGPTSLLGGSLALPLVMPNGVFDLTAQMAVLSPAAPSGLWMSAAGEVHSAPCTSFTQSLNLGDDDNELITLGQGGDHDCLPNVSFGGTTHTSFHVNSNGTVSFGGGINDFSPSTGEFVSQGPRFGFWSDINPNNGGTITVTSLTSGIITVSYAGLSPYSGSGTATYDLEFDSTVGSCAIMGYNVVNWGQTSIVGLNPASGGSGAAVDWSSFVGTTQNPGAPGLARYEFGSTAPGGFSNLLFPNGHAGTFIVN